MDSTEEEREKSQILNVGIDNQTNRWEIIVKYHGNLDLWKKSLRTHNWKKNSATFIFYCKNRISQLIDYYNNVAIQPW